MSKKRIRSRVEAPRVLRQRNVRLSDNHSYGDTLITAPASSDWFADEVESKIPPWNFKPCIHTAQKVVVLADDSKKWAPQGACSQVNGDFDVYEHSPFGFGYYNNTNWDFSHRVLENSAPILTDKLGQYSQDLARLVERTLLPQLKRSVDLAVFIGEIRELGKMAQQLREVALGLSNIKVGKTLVRLLNGSLTSEIVLSYSFGYAPLVSSFIDTVNGILGVKKQVEALTAGVGKLCKTHGGFTVDTATQNFEQRVSCLSYVDGTCPNRGAHTYTLLEEISGKIGVTILYKYKLPSFFNKFEGDLAAFVHALGLNPGVDTIWQLMPFSFVIDWAFPIGQMLERMRPSPYDLEVQIIDACVSYHGKSMHRYGSHMPCRGYCNLFECERTLYERVKGLPALGLMPELRLPTGYQLVLGGSLLRGAKK